MTQIHHTITVNGQPVPIVLTLNPTGIDVEFYNRAVTRGDELGRLSCRGRGTNLVLETLQRATHPTDDVEGEIVFANVAHTGKIPGSPTLIEIDVRGGLVQDVRCNQPNARVLVRDEDAEEAGEDPRTNLLAVYDPTLGREDDPDIPF